MIEDALADYLAAVGQAWPDLCEPRRPLSQVDLEDASAYLGAVTEGALRFVFADPAAPSFEPWVTTERRWADNGRDSRYWMAPVDGTRRYRVSGTRGDECYLSFTVYAGSPGHPETVALNVNHRDLGAGPGEPYELEIEPPADACYVIARQYFLDPDRDRPATMSAAVVAGPPATVPAEEELAARWRAAAGFVRSMSRPPATGARPSYAAAEPNRIGVPAGWRSDEGGGRGTPDQTYALGRYRLAPDEALLMDVRLPRCTYASVVLWNRFGQSIDTRRHRSTLNARELEVGDDGVARVVVAHRDPGVGNWLDAGGREQGTVFWRFLLSEEQPAPIPSAVVPVVDAARAGTAPGQTMP